MDVNAFIQIINGCGFPIFACCAMGYYIMWTRKQNLESKKYNYELLKESIDKQTEAVNALVKIIEQTKRSD